MLIIAFSAGSALFLSAGDYAVAQPGQGPPGGFDPRAMCQKHYEKMDMNQDGIVTLQEFMVSSEEMFKRRDLDRNGQLSRDEFCPDKPPMDMPMNPNKQ